MIHLKRLLIIYYFIFVGCQSAHKNFVQHNEGLQHQPTGLVFPEKMNNWQRTGEIAENLSPEILAEISYQYISDEKDFKPRTTVYLLKNKSTANMKLIENRSLTTFVGSQFVKNENPKLKSKNKLSVNIYNHTVDLKNNYTYISVNKEIKAQSFFVQNAKKLNLVFLLTINREASEEKKLALQFVDDFLSAN